VTYDHFPTRWTVRTGAIEAILSNHSTLCTILEEVRLLDTLLISRRFDQDDFSLGGCHTRSCSNFIQIEDLNIVRLSTHLSMLPDIIKSYGEATGTPIKKFTNVRTVCQAMNEIPGAKTCSELHRLLRLFLTISVTRASSERTLSATTIEGLSSMTQERLNHILLLNCLKPRTDSIDINLIASSFISVNEQREQFFWEIMTIFCTNYLYVSRNMLLCCPTTLHVSPPPPI